MGSSSFSITLKFELKDGRELCYSQNGYGDDSTVHAKLYPEELGEAKSIDDLIELLHRGIVIDWGYDLEYPFDPENPSDNGGVEYGYYEGSAAWIIEQLKNLKGMDDIETIRVESEEICPYSDPYTETWGYYKAIKMATHDTAGVKPVDLNGEHGGTLNDPLFDENYALPPKTSLSESTAAAASSSINVAGKAKNDKKQNNQSIDEKMLDEYSRKIENALAIDEIRGLLDKLQLLPSCDKTDELIQHCQERIREHDQAEKDAEDIRKGYLENKQAYEDSVKPLTRMTDEKKKIEAEIKKQDEMLATLQEDIRSLHGLFNGKKRKELEERADSIKKDRDANQEQANKLQNDIADLNDKLSNMKPSEERLNYDLANTYFKAHAYTEAYEYFSLIRGYEDVNYIINDSAELLAVRARKVDCYKERGNSVFFGRCVQDENSPRGKDPIEWIVLDTQQDKSLLLSRYILDVKDYYPDRDDITWEDSAIRKWLNGPFMSAFSTKEQTAILTTDVDNSSRQGNRTWNTKDGKSTKDKVFLLSYAEANKYLSEKERVCESTPYAEPKEEQNWKGYWWLRSPGRTLKEACVVNRNGKFFYMFNHMQIGIRPALWIDLNSEIF